MAAEAPDTTYNGWRNHATWMVHLHLSNTESLYHSARETAKTSSEDLEQAGATGDLLKSDAEERRLLAEHYAEDRFKEWVGELIEVVFEMLPHNASVVGDLQSLIHDLTTSYLGEVDWREVRAAFLEDS